MHKHTQHSLLVIMNGSSSFHMLVVTITTSSHKAAHTPAFLDISMLADALLAGIALNAFNPQDYVDYGYSPVLVAYPHLLE